MDINKYLISENSTILDTLEKIEKSGRGILYVCDNAKLLASITDGDIRRALIKKEKLSTCIKEIANYSPIFLNKGNHVNYKEYMIRHGINSIPIVDSNKNIIKIEFLSVSSIHDKLADLNIPVVIMAGGKGVRLRPYTDILPKPLIPVGNKPITEHIMDRFERYGCDVFNMIVNYKKNFIKSYFMENEIKREVCFTEENEYLGTGGGLALLKGKYDSTFFVSNCDILVDADYKAMIDFHKKEKNIITMICVKKNMVIPYGTVKTNENKKVTELIEKPNFTFLTNTGLYILEPEFLEYIPDEQFIDITDLIQKCIDERENVGSYIIDEESWMDMGQLEELEKMKIKLEEQNDYL